ncbi:receptor-like protein EIX2 isoform X2 [Prosopis cineraria]|uniref:receptor-like protein EIX2 isoform X2 n=1 Tax=Prosopis cineraria TaxID=364024 RepID=UPI00240F6A1C|nr:receptor-like protein EIX2 isoform X2 [Prosopis cineraria]
MKILNPVSLKLLQVILVFELHLLALNGTWRATGAAVRCPEKERQALLHFKDGLVDNNGRLSSWGSEEENRDCCQWDGVHCSNRTGHVEILDLHGEFDDSGEQQFVLQGNISASLLELQYLKYLNLSYNDFGDNHVPEFFGSLRNLRFLDLRSCYFGGQIPSQLGNLSNLRYLDLGKIGLVGEIPYQLGYLSQLLYLDLGENTLEGTIPYQLGNLSKLHKLDLGFNAALKLTKEEDQGGGQWLSSLTSLTQLDLSMVINLNHSHNWLQMIGKLPNLRQVSLTSCSLSDDSIIPLTPSKWKFSDSLAMFDLSDNRFTSSIIFQWLSNVSSNLVELDLSKNHLKGLIPNELGKMTSLEYLDLSENTLHGGIPKSFRDICTLQSLTLTYNLLNEELPTIIENLSGCARQSLQNLDLSWNQITGTLPDLSIFTSLKTLMLTKNRLNESIPEDIRFSSQLVTLSIHSNSLKGVITESHFANASNLKTLDLSENSLALKFGKNWIPSFQLDQIFLRSCKLGPDFPNWLHTQSNFSILDISDAGISDIVPHWFWGLLTPNLLWLNVSYNNLWGTIPNSPVRFFGSPDISLASNQFEGLIPSFLRGASVIDLSTNKFSESATFLCDNSSADVLASLDISSNQLSGKIPPSIGSLLALQALIMRSNKLTGELPSSLKTCTSLKMLDVGENRLSGPIPSWLGDELQQLQMLSLRNNRFSGSLPLHLCYLTSLQLLDLSLNNLSGQIFKCLKNFTSMIQESSTNLMSPSMSSNGSTPFYQYDIIALLMWKGAPQMFKHSKLLKSIDLSSNQIKGVIPEEIVDLVELISLNLSRNSLSGRVPFGIGRLMSLEFLDLSRNNLSGSIPSSLALIDRLTMLDLSHNQLSGKIPTGTQLQSFNGSSYEENLDLCGKPLYKSCYEEKTPQEPVEVQEDEDSFISKGFYLSISLGFIIGFWGIFGSIYFNRSWRHAYFKFLGNVADWIYVKAALNVAKSRR